MVAKAGLNLDRTAHQGAINRVTEVFCAPANTAVLISGDILGVLVVRSPGILEDLCQKGLSQL